AVCRLFAGGVLQPKLQVGPAGDRYEREADRVADEVMRNFGPSVTPEEEDPRVRRSAVDGFVGLEGGDSGPDTPVPGFQRASRVTRMVLQRRTEPDVWTNQIEPRLLTKTVADFERDADQVDVKVAKRGPNDYLSKVGAGNPARIPVVNTFLAAHTWMETLSTGKDLVNFSANQTLRSNADLTQPTVPLDVQDVEGDKHNLLHYTTTPYKTAEKRNEPSQAREQGHHLTVENAHLLFLLTLQQDKTLEYLDKTTLDKPAVNMYINAQGAAGIDNLNFFPEDQESRPLTSAIPMGKLQTMADLGTENVDKLLSLDVYMRFVAKVARELPNVSAVYATKMLHSLQVMQQLTHLNPAQMFLKVGKGDQRQVLRTLVTVALKGMAPNLALPAETLATFRRYIEPKPYLPAAEPVNDQTEWIVEAGLGKQGVRYNDLEPVYVRDHYPGVIEALKTYLG
ncbi:MAG: hypothetical protein LC733_13630, partial [Actinobacteria bacterium]|nr:hypothetical protein [Actinomycetota bacterium]